MKVLDSAYTGAFAKPVHLVSNLVESQFHYGAIKNDLSMIWISKKEYDGICLILNIFIDLI